MPVLVGMLSCGGVGRDDLPGTRGYILISIDTLRADHLGCYGYGEDTSPFIDSLADRGVRFEHAFVQLPGTLPSHMSIFTGLYPAEHGVYPPAGVLPSDIETLPEVFRRGGFRTAGHTEGGYVHGRFGFARGFDEFDDEANGRETDVERTLARGLEFLERLGPQDRFLLFLHTYVVHDPYAPEASYLRQFWDGPIPEAFPPIGPNLTAFNRGEKSLSSEAVSYFRAAYDASIRYADDVLREFFAEVEALGLDDEVTVILTSDHGEEFVEHGMLAHSQIYRETLQVPLIVVHPAVAGPRVVSAVVESIDIPAALYELAGLEPERPISGSSFVSLLRGVLPRPDETEAFAERHDRRARSVIRSREGELHQLVLEESGGPQGWISGSTTFDAFTRDLEIEARSFHAARELRVEADGEFIKSVSLDPRRWTRIQVPFVAGSARTRVTLASEGCSVPAEVGESTDRRCLSFQIRGAPLRRLELYEIIADPMESRDLSREGYPVVRDLLDRLESSDREPRASPETGDLDSELEARLKALGYLH